MVLLFTCLITLQFAIIVSHDLIDIPGWVHGSQVQALIGRRKVWLATLANSVFPGIAAGLAIYFWHRPRPAYVPNYWVIYCAVALLSAVGMWYVPYLRGAPQKQKSRILKHVCGNSANSPCAWGQSPHQSLSHGHPSVIHGEFLPGFGVAFLPSVRVAVSIAVIH
jgi:hypothetical protein